MIKIKNMRNKYAFLLFTIACIIFLASCNNEIKIDSSTDGTYIGTLYEIKSELTLEEKEKLDDDILLIITYYQYGQESNAKSLIKLKEDITDERALKRARGYINNFTHTNIKDKANEIREILSKEGELNSTSNQTAISPIAKIEIDTSVYFPISKNTSNKVPSVNITLSNNTTHDIAHITGKAKMTYNGSVYYEPEFSYLFTEPLKHSDKKDLSIELTDSTANMNANLYLPGIPQIEILSMTDTKNNKYKIEEDPILDMLIQDAGDELGKIMKFNFVGKLL